MQALTGESRDDTLETLVQDTPQNLWRRIYRRAAGFVAGNRIFALTVILPTTLAILYFGLIASDIYISESRFVVRSPQKQNQMGIVGAILQNTGFSRSQDDTYPVHDFILSRDALKALDDSLQLKKTYSSSGIDFLNRFGIDWDDSFEALYKYYSKRVTIDYDSASSITTLKVSGFSAKEVYVINNQLLRMSEDLINKLNDRAREDVIGYATREEKAAEVIAKDAALALSAFRNSQGIVDPDRESAMQLQAVLKLQDDLISSKTQLAEVRTFSPNNPQIPVLQKRIETLQTEIRNETVKVTGGNKSLVSKASTYERLTLDRGFADKVLASALSALETARNDAQRQQLYLERIVEANTPDVAVEPRRIRSIFATFFLGLVAWGVLTILVAGVREHRD